MIPASALLRFLLSSGGVITLFAAAAVWNALSSSRRARRALLGLALAYSLLAWEPLAAAAARWLVRPFHQLTRADVPPGETAVVLLGSGSFTVENWDGLQHSIPDVSAAHRTLEAFRVYTILDARWIISSGGQPDPTDPDPPSGQTMAGMLRELGVPPERLRIEHESRTTRDEAVIVKRMLPALGSPQVVLVTSASHMRRSLAVFRSVGLQPIPAIARWSDDEPRRWRSWVVPSTDGLDTSETVLHELLGIAYYWLRGWQA